VKRKIEDAIKVPSEILQSTIIRLCYIYVRRIIQIRQRGRAGCNTRVLITLTGYRDKVASSELTSELTKIEILVFARGEERSQAFERRQLTSSSFHTLYDKAITRS